MTNSQLRKFMTHNVLLAKNTEQESSSLHWNNFWNDVAAKGKQNSKKSLLTSIVCAHMVPRIQSNEPYVNWFRGKIEIPTPSCVQFTYEIGSFNHVWSVLQTQTWWHATVFYLEIKKKKLFLRIHLSLKPCASYGDQNGVQRAARTMATISHKFSHTMKPLLFFAQGTTHDWVVLAHLKNTPPAVSRTAYVLGSPLRLRKQNSIVVSLPRNFIFDPAQHIAAEKIACGLIKKREFMHFLSNSSTAKTVTDLFPVSTTYTH